MPDSRCPHAAQPPALWNTLVRWIAGGVVDEAVRTALAEQRAEHDAQLAASLEPILEWIRGAETHLAALQMDHDRLRALYGERLELDRGPTRASLFERLDDLERAQTALAVDWAKARVSREMA